MAKILITGGAGFIGTHLAETLIQKKHKVLIVDKVSLSGGIFFVNKKAKFIKGNILDYKILKKIGEESAETIIAAKDADNDKIIYEVADLWFHTLVLLAHQGLSPNDVLTELDKRFGVSGHLEKASRSDQNS